MTHSRPDAAHGDSIVGNDILARYDGPGAQPSDDTRPAYARRPQTRIEAPDGIVGELDCIAEWNCMDMGYIAPVGFPWARREMFQAVRQVQL